MITEKKRPRDDATKSVEPIKSKIAKLATKQQKKLKKKPSIGDGAKLVNAKPNKFTKNPSAAGAGDTRVSKNGFKKNKFIDKKNGSLVDVKKGEEHEKTDWKKYKQEKKDLKLKRKQSKDSYEVSIEAKQIYEKLKCRRNTGKKNELVEKLYNLFSANDLLQKIVMAHDTARIVQCMLKFAEPSLREQLSEKLVPHAVEMATSKYSHFCVLRMFKYGSQSSKSRLVDSFMGHIVKLACHNISSKILDHAYLMVASAKQKNYMRQEFYGDLYKRSKDDNVKELRDTYIDTPDMKASILGSVKSNLDHVANKKLVDNSLVHAIMLEYLRECDEDKVEETVAMYAPLTPLMLSTRDGAQAAIICFYKAAPKHRRAIIKTIKEHLVKICTHEHGHVFILAVLNSLDDTKATKKAIYDNIHPELKTLMSNQWGRRVIEWLMAPADTSCFHPSFIASIEDGLQYGKKDKDLRRKEIFEQVEEPIANAIAEQPEFWISDRHIAVVTADILKNISGVNFEKAATALATIICSPSWRVGVEEEGASKEKSKSQDIEKVIAAATKLKNKKLQESKGKNIDDQEEDSDAGTDSKDNEQKEQAVISIPGIEEAGLHVALKKIIKNDKERSSAKGETFGSILIRALSTETLKHWITVNRGCFILLNIVENNSESTVEALKELLKPIEDRLKEQTSSGGQLLLKKLAF